MRLEGLAWGIWRGDEGEQMHICGVWQGLGVGVYVGRRKGGVYYARRGLCIEQMSERLQQERVSRPSWRGCANTMAVPARNSKGPTICASSPLLCKGEWSNV